MEMLGEITIKTTEYRPCYVDGKKALFHRWEEKENLIIKHDGRFGIKPEVIARKMRENASIGILDTNYSSLDHISAILAIVEYEDGTVAEVEPTAVRFVPGLMREYCFEGE